MLATKKNEQKKGIKSLLGFFPAACREMHAPAEQEGVLEPIPRRLAAS